MMNANQLIRKHDPKGLGEFSNDNYFDLFNYTRKIEMDIEKKDHHIANLLDALEELLHTSRAEVPAEFISEYEGCWAKAIKTIKRIKS